jgi:hypothetical protein
MKKDFLSKIKGEILSAKDAKIIQGGYDISPCNAPKCTQRHPPVGVTLWCGSAYHTFYTENSQYCLA